MKYHITSVEIKSADWKIVSGNGADGTVLDNASVNRTNKKGETFPNFDGIEEGVTIDANLWVSDKGKQYLFPPKEDRRPFAPRAKFDASAVMQKKAEHIDRAQDRKEESIKLAAIMRDTTLLTSALINAGKVDDWQAEWTNIKHWLTERYDAQSIPPF